MGSIAVLMTCHNRKNKTLNCLRALYRSTVKVPGFEIEVYLVDDGSTDNTSNEVNVNYPQVNIIQGNGQLFWNRGMHLAWETATSVKKYDYFFWLNDDTILNENSLQILIKTSKLFNDKAIIVGTTTSIGNNSQITYGGRDEKDGYIVSPKNEAVICDFFNGNIVFVPKYVFELIGFNDACFRHALGDFDYGLRARKKGVKLYIAPGLLGECDAHDSLPLWCNPAKKFKQRWKSLHTPLGHNPEEYFVYELRHKGLLKACFHYATNYLRVFYPSIWIK